MTHSLTLGSLLLTDGLPDAEHGYSLSVLADGVTFGVAAGVREIITSLLADGDLVRITRYGNREVSFAVEISGPSLEALAQGESSLRRELGRGNTLTWQAPDVLAAPTVFEVITSEMSQSFDDLDELRKRRRFTVTLTCAPWARSAVLTTIGAFTAGTTTANIDTCDTTTGWSATYSGGSATPANSWEAGSVGVAELNSAVTSPETWTLTRTGSVNFSSTPFLVAQVRTLSSGVGRAMDVTAYAGSTTSAPLLPVLSVRKLSGSTYFEVVYDASNVVGGTVSALTFRHTSNSGEVWQGLFIANLARTNIPPNITVRQQTRVLQAGGTERTPASIHVQSPNGTANLGTTIVHTSPEDGSGYSPPLRRWRKSGNGTPTADTTIFSGFREPIHPNAFVAEVPTSALPEGGYLLAAFLRCTTTETVRIYWALDTIPPGGTAVGHVEDSFLWSFVANVWMLVPLGVVSLPTVRTKAGSISLGIQRDALSGASVQIDEGWLFRVGDDCALSVVNVDYPHLWLDSPDVNNPVPTMSVGVSEGARTHPGPGLVGMGSHLLHPDGTALFTGSSVTNNPAADASFYRRFHSNVTG